MLDTIEKKLRTLKDLPLRWDIAVITPDIAKEWLTKNKKNRKISDKVVAQYSRDIKSGNWKLTGDPIRFDTTGNLIDGQHRLKACVTSGVNFTTVVLYGLQPSDQDVIDTARVRTAVDVLAMRGYQGTSILSSMCRLIVAMKSGASLSRVKISHSEILRIVGDRPKLMASVGMVWHMPPGIPRPALAVVHYIASNVLEKRNVADAFVAVFKTGIPHYDGCAAHALRERLIRSSDTRNTIKREGILRACMHAWNAFEARQRVATFKVPKDVSMRGVDVKKI